MRRRRDRHAPDDWPQLPLRPGPVSNGEYVPREPNAQERTVWRAILAESERAAHRAGIDRRRFLTTAGGVAAALTVFSACSDGETGSAGGASRRAGAEAPSSTGFTEPPPE